MSRCFSLGPAWLADTDGDANPMSTKTGIEWTGATWNPVRGCSRVSEGCRNCYAETMAARFSGPGQPYHGLAERTPKGARWTGEVRVVEEHLTDPLRWTKPRRVFVNSMSDLFHDALPDEAIDAVFAVIVMAEQHSFQVLTKRPNRMMGYVNDPKTPDRIRALIERELSGALFKATYPAIGWPLPNVWLGVSVEDQAAADERIPLLIKTAATLRWISAEPLLGPVDLRCLHDLDVPTNINALSGRHGINYPLAGKCERLDWVVVGGESGAGSRPMHPDWARTLRDQCMDAGVKFFFKQWGNWRPIDLDPEMLVNSVGGRQMAILPDGQLWTGTWNRSSRPDGLVVVENIGKKEAGAILDGREWREFPAVELAVAS